MHNQLLYLRQRRGLTQQQVAAELGISAAAVSRHESGQRSLSRELIDRYATLYGVTPMEIFISCEE